MSRKDGSHGKRILSRDLVWIQFNPRSKSLKKLLKSYTEQSGIGRDLELIRLLCISEKKRTSRETRESSKILRSLCFNFNIRLNLSIIPPFSPAAADIRAG